MLGLHTRLLDYIGIQGRITFVLAGACGGDHEFEPVCDTELLEGPFQERVINRCAHDSEPYAGFGEQFDGFNHPVHRHSLLKRVAHQCLYALLDRLAIELEIKFEVDALDPIDRFDFNSAFDHSSTQRSIASGDFLFADAIESLRIKHLEHACWQSPDLELKPVVAVRNRIVEVVGYELNHGASKTSGITMRKTHDSCLILRYIVYG